MPEKSPTWAGQKPVADVAETVSTATSELQAHRADVTPTGELDWSENRFPQDRNHPAFDALAARLGEEANRLGMDDAKRAALYRLTVEQYVDAIRNHRSPLNDYCEVARGFAYKNPPIGNMVGCNADSLPHFLWQNPANGDAKSSTLSRREMTRLVARDFGVDVDEIDELEQAEKDGLLPIDELRSRWGGLDPTAAWLFRYAMKHRGDGPLTARGIAKAAARPDSSTVSRAFGRLAAAELFDAPPERSGAGWKPTKNAERLYRLIRDDDASETQQ